MRNSGIVLYVLLIVLFNTFSATAQKKSMFCSLTWEQAAELAQKENKIILVDAMRKPATAEAQKQKDKEDGRKCLPTWSFANSMWWPSVSIWLPKRARLLLRN